MKTKSKKVKLGYVIVNLNDGTISRSNDRTAQVHRTKKDAKEIKDWFKAMFNAKQAIANVYVEVPSDIKKVKFDRD